MKLILIKQMIAVWFLFIFSIPLVALAESSEDEKVYAGHFVEGSCWEYVGDPGTRYEILSPDLIRVLSEKDGCAEFKLIRKGEGDLRVYLPDGTHFIYHCIIGGEEVIPLIEQEAAANASIEMPLLENDERIATPDDYVEQMLTLVNQARDDVGIPPLRLSKELMEAATVRANELIQQFSHTRPNGKTCASMFENGARTIGENIAAGHASPIGTVEEWMESSEDRDNILDADYTELGIGFAHSRNSTYHYYWVQIFRRPTPKVLQQKPDSGLVDGFFRQSRGKY